MAGVTSSDRILAHVGHVTRTLLDSMSGLGLDRQIEHAAQAVPDARDRLRYVATMTEEAAERVLAAVELAKPLQQALEQEAVALELRWSRYFDGSGDRADVRELMRDTHAFVGGRIPEASAATNQHLLDILMAQSFQDLTGQVIKKLMDIVILIEQQLLSVLLEHITPERREQFAANAAALASSNAPETLKNGPQIDPEGKPGVMQGQADVDDLLASLGL
ncbi:protein phosphatase CheZ [Trinickia sp. NRRL B-1857]|uniref:protein phosphatase CheZ n=1 Tax=Trinickia sp. NRRL B-1857 TaxID=3162879 RepID=UPI003D284C58